MTAKQQAILITSTELFLAEGYHAVSTNRIAKQANVSEGLIFRHYKNKKGLLDGVLNKLLTDTKNLFLPITTEKEPIEIIRKTLDFPFAVETGSSLTLRLLIKLQCELGNKDIQVFELLKSTLVKAFGKLRFKNPDLEAEFLIHHLHGVTGAIMNNDIKDKDAAKALLLRKYHIQ